MTSSQIRKLINDKLRDILLERELPEEHGATRQCLFLFNGCKRSFESWQDLKLHVPNCIFGIMQFCKQVYCKDRYKVINCYPAAFEQHAIESHECHMTRGTQLDDIIVILYGTFFMPSPKGYNINLMECFEFMVERDRVRMLLGLVLQDIGLEDSHRVMTLPLVYTPDHGDKISHMIEIETHVRGKDGVDILPICYPGYELEGKRNAVVTSYGFNSTLDFIRASDRLDGLVAYLSKDIQIYGDKHVCPTNLLNISMNVLIKSYRCIVKEFSGFPMAPWALNWIDLLLQPGVRETMSDGHQDRPSYLTRILLPQIKGNVDVMVESAEVDQVTNAVASGFIDEILKAGPRKDLPTRNVLALVIYPNVSAMQSFQSEWRRRTNALGIDILVIDSVYECLKNYLKRFGCEIILTTQFFLYEMMRSADSNLMDILTNEVKLVYFHNHYENCQDEAKYQIEWCMSQLPSKETGILRIAYAEYICEPPFCQAALLNNGNNNEQESNPPHIFDRGWNVLTLGPDQDRLVDEMSETVIPSPNLDTTIQIMVDSIRASGEHKRWVILHTDDFGGVDEVKTCISNEFGLDHVVTATDEMQVLCNVNFWDPFLLRNNTTVLIGPFFLLNFPEICNCDGVIFYSPPPHQAYRVRVSNFTKLPDNSRKPVISFECITYSDNEDEVEVDETEVD